MTQAFIHRIGIATPDHQAHEEFVRFADNLLKDERSRALFKRMVSKSDIDSRYSVLQIQPPYESDSINAHDFYSLGSFPSTQQRMQAFEQFAPLLLRKALDRLALTPSELRRVRHVIVTSCTGHYAPGLDFEVIDHLKLTGNVGRSMIGFMGCYAALNGLQHAYHIVRSAPEDDVLLVNLELCTLHLQESQDLSEVLSFLVFGDGCAATLVSSRPAGFAIDSFRSVMAENTRDLITWRVANEGFLMYLSGQVPHALEHLLSRDERLQHLKSEIDLWAVHPGGRTVLDATQNGLQLPINSLSASRHVLRCYGNMSSATVMFVLAELMKIAKSRQRGLAMSFGPGLTAEMMEFHAV